MKKYLAMTVAGTVLFGLMQQADAVSQWSRKYDVSCTTCHNAFPRLNPFGEAFMQNGFQMPGDEDGDDIAKLEIGENLNLNELVDIFGIRLNLTPVDYKTDARTEADGTKDDKFDIGNANWLQLFTAGTIFKNVTIFIETEIEQSEIHTSWFTLGFHNLFGQGGLANIRVGRLSALEWHTVSGRLRQIPAIKHQVISRYKSSNGTGDDSVAIAAAYPAIEYYGYNDQFVWAVGIQNGAKSTDPNDEKNLFATLKYYVANEGDFEGTAVSAAYLTGTDTKVIETAEAQNDFYRWSPGVNVRYKGNTDLQVAYFAGSDDNWDLTLADQREVDFDAITAVVGHWLNDLYWVAAQYDKIDSDDDTADFEKATATVYVFPRDNMRVGLYGRVDLDSVGKDVHEAFVNIRTMF